ncbi:hypothetical protein, partial [Escherichia coli]|uniref:hypothetical protein n=1 Tax=Escherichia coli TaxID=562 RepID=UPI001BD1C9FB
MQRKTLLSACIALALSGQGWAADITEVETTTGEKKNTNVTCPADPGKLSPEESLYIDLCNCLILICSIQHQMKVNLWTKNSYRLWLTN